MRIAVALAALATCGVLAAGPASAEAGVTAKLVKQFRPNAQSGYPSGLADVNGTLYFAADGIHGSELWRSDGTAAGTRMVRDIEPGDEGSNPEDLTAVDGVLYFSAADDARGRELWRTVRKAKRR